MGLAVALTGCKSLPPPTPLEQLNAPQMHGHAVFQAHCLVCHYDRRDKPLHGPSMVGVFKRPTPSARTGAGNMSAFTSPAMAV